MPSDGDYRSMAPGGDKVTPWQSEGTSSTHLGSVELTRADKKRAEKTIQAQLDSWMVNNPLAAKVHGSSPLGDRYPCDALVVSLSICLEFPPEISDSVDAGDQTAAIRALVAETDDELADILADVGCSNLGTYWDEDARGFTIAHHFPPVWGNEGPEILRCFRLVTEAEKAAYTAETGEEFPPFSDEQWVEIRFAGINLFRTVEWRP